MATPLSVLNISLDINRRILTNIQIKIFKKQETRTLNLGKNINPKLIRLGKDRIASGWLAGDNTPTFCSRLIKGQTADR